MQRSLFVGRHFDMLTGQIINAMSIDAVTEALRLADGSYWQPLHG